MATFVDTKRRKYSEEDFNSRESFNGAEFQTLELLKGTSIRRLPRDIKVLRDLNLPSNIEEISEGLVVERRLNLSDSQVTRIPDNVVAGSLDLRGSKVASIGAIQINNGRLFANRTDVFKSKIQCGSLVLTDPSISEFDLQNIEVSTVSIESSGVFNIKNANCRDFVIHSVNQREALTIQEINISNSQIVMLKMGDFLDSGSLILRLISSVQSLNLQLTAHEGKNCLVSLDNPVIDEILVQVIDLEDMSDGRLVFDHLVVTTDEFKIQKVQGTKKVKDKISLPSNGIIYGNMDIPKEIEVPETFCCFGDIYRD